jgi:D-aminopeptidase
VLPPAVTQNLICETAQQALRRFQAGQAPAPLLVETPATVTVEFFYSDMADKAALLPGSTRLDGRRIEFVVPDMPSAYRGFRAAVQLAIRS